MTGLPHEEKHHAMGAEAKGDWGQNAQTVLQAIKRAASDKENKQRKQHHRAAHPHADVHHL
jgi:hypothetical protein